MNADQLLERTQWDTFWVPPDTAVVDRPELLFTAHPGGAPMLNAVHRVRAHDRALDPLLAEVTDAHGACTSRLAVNPQNDGPGLRAALARWGYAPTQRHDGYVLGTDAARPPVRAGLVVRRVADLTDLRAALGVAHRAFGGADAPDEELLPTWLSGCADPAGRVHRFVVFDRDGKPLAAAGMTVFPDLRFAFLWAGGTVPEARGRGAYSALVTARLHQARALGATAAGLYAMLETSAPIVAAQGFVQHGPMTFWDRPAPGAQGAGTDGG